MPTDANANHRFKALIFDFDGTLIDSAPDLHGAAVRMLVPLGRREPSVAEVALMIGDGVPKLVERCFAATGDIPPEDEFAAHVSAFIKDYEPRSAELTTVFPNAKDALQGLKDEGIKTVICTNKPFGATMEILKKLDLEQYFDGVIGGDTIPGVKKPDPRHLAAGLEAIGADKENAVMVGDNGNDVKAAHALGIPVILLSHGYTKIPVGELGAEIVIDGFTELSGALEKI
ncbi:MAG: HAD-IA family hydrolase [Rhodospirillaceae bacterium]|nr:HAD-IA family hydrolase [Rhodospirillaceae bacterium]